MRTIITGGAGFIGLALAQRLAGLAGLSDEILLVDNLARHGANDGLNRLVSNPCVRLIQADLSLAASLDQIPTPIDRVYHLAARVGVGLVTAAPADVLRTNTLSTLNVFQWFADHASPGARLLFASTSEVYSGALLAGFDLPVPTPEAVPAVIPDLDNPRFSYALSKMWGEAYAKYLSHTTDAHFVSVRYHNVYGPQMGNEHVIPQIVHRVRMREDPFQIIGADQTRSFCWVGDAVEATHRTMESSRLTPGVVVHIGNQQGEVEIGRLYDMIFELCGWVPQKRVALASPSGSVPRRCPDVTNLRSLTGYEPSTRLHEGLGKTVTWYLEQSQ